MRDTLWLFAVLTVSPVVSMAGEPPVSFNRDVRPILSDHCFTCHGPDAGTREAGLRLDRREDALATLDSESAAVVPGDPEASELIFRITEEDDLIRMPPPESRKRLTPEQVQTLRRWVQEGAVWEDHWSLIPPRRPTIPKVAQPGRARNPIDRFILARLDRDGLTPSSEADRVTLARRLSLDLTGLPPTPEEVDQFVHDESPYAFERLVDRWLGSPRYGERMAVFWLDLVRYADTVGYHSDVDRSVSLYRDYVIDAFNTNIPFDRFTIEQLAGDLLPEPTTWQRVASAYNMLGMTTEEGGAQAKEYLARYAADRVRNAGSVWLGATLGCAECHDHKYDPYSTREFYEFAAFFADVQQQGVGTPKPTLSVPTPEQAEELARLNASIAASRARGDKAETTKAEQARARLLKVVRSTVVSTSGEPRVTRILRRGDWMDESGEIVGPAVPRALGGLEPPDGQRPTRLDLARWLVRPDHPQTARVMVNRLWKRYFGTGLSDTLDDLGSQGEWPTHPDLLDWLAVTFIESGWDVKRLVRLMVTSATYRQSSRPRDDLATVDPANRLYARQSSVRLEAEQVRDLALSVSGLLNSEIGGESVRPYQPAGYWRFLNFPQRQYQASAGPDQYRRGLYTHWQRTLLHPSMLAFDAPSRESCTAKRPVSNTPQAALALLNDPSYVEAARALAGRALLEGGTDDDQRLRWLFRTVLSRVPGDEERTILRSLLKRHREEFAADPAAALAILDVGLTEPDTRLEPAALASWTSVARALLNLDETIMRD
ncbi:MAG: PSD1 and planctomycete cytochrome C domain-containing protein [Isosphaeraceae bacterium]